MAKEARGKVKKKLWFRPTCTDDSDSFEFGQMAHDDFIQDANAEEHAIDVVSIDVLDEANEWNEPGVA